MDSEIAPLRNKAAYVIGHLIAVHHKLIEGMEFGPRFYPELDATYLTAQTADMVIPSFEELIEKWNKVNAFLDEISIT